MDTFVKSGVVLRGTSNSQVALEKLKTRQVRKHRVRVLVSRSGGVPRRHAIGVRRYTHFYRLPARQTATFPSDKQRALSSGPRLALQLLRIKGEEKCIENRLDNFREGTFVNMKPNFFFFFFFALLIFSR